MNKHVQMYLQTIKLETYKARLKKPNYDEYKMFLMPG